MSAALDRLRQERDGSGGTLSARLSNHAPDRWFDLVDCLAEDDGDWRQFLRRDGEEDVVLGGVVDRIVDGRKALAPLVVPAQEELVKRWIEAQLRIELDREPLAFALTSGIVLRLLVEKRAWVPSVPIGVWEEDGEETGGSSTSAARVGTRKADKYERRRARRRERRLGVEIVGEQALLRAVGVGEEPRAPLPSTYSSCARSVGRFLHHVRNLGLDPSDVFEVDDLLFYRNVPRVIRTIAAFARHRDYDGFSQIANGVAGARVTWTEEDEPDERWDGDDLIGQLVLSFKKVSSKRQLGILVAGPMGCGKSATVNTILGRYALPLRHNLAYVTEDCYFDDDEVFERRKQRDCLSDPLVRFKLDSSVQPNTCVSKTYVKVHGVAVTFTELPSQEEFVSGTADGQILIKAKAGDPEAVRNAIVLERYDLVLLVGRTNDTGHSDHSATYRSLSTLFGPRIWDRALFVLTHGCSLPPADLSYAEHISHCQQTCHAIANQFSGSSSPLILPSVVIENSKSCAGDKESGERVLMDGSVFLPKLLRAMETVLFAHHGLAPLITRRRRPWWETWVLGGVILWLLSSRL